MRRGEWTILFLLLAPELAHAEFPTTRPYSQVTYAHEQRRDPDLSLYVLKIDLNDAGTDFRLATAGADPDGEGPWQTTLLPVSQVAKRESFDIAINASFFEIREGTTDFRINAWASSVGWTMSDGKLLTSKPRGGWPIVWMGEDRHIRMGIVEQLPRDARLIVTGNGLVMQGGKPVEKFDGNLIARHPRTVIGADQTGRILTILIVDGRRQGVSVGMTGAELAAEMHRLGCWDAINLDGGGSTTLLMRDPQADELKLLNQPSGNSERAVSNSLGITFKRRPAPATNAQNN